MATKTKPKTTSSKAPPKKAAAKKAPATKERAKVRALRPDDLDAVIDPAIGKNHRVRALRLTHLA